MNKEMHIHNLVSVIIPVYNVADYLTECIQSVLNQTYRNIEIVIIDDGSTDGSGSICDKAAENDERIKVTHQENNGVAAARNAGLDAATGEYIMFVDSDDYIEPDAVEYLLNIIVHKSADLVIGDYVRVNTDDERLDSIEGDEKSVELISQKRFWEIVRTVAKPIGIVLVARLYRASIWDGIRFEKGFIHEDQMITHRIIDRCTKIYMTNKVLYNYRRTPNSIMTKPFRIENLDYAKGLTDRIEYFKENENYEDVLYTFGAGTREILKGYERLDLSDEKVKKKLDDLYTEYKGIARYIMGQSCKITIKIRMWMFIYCRRLYSCIRKFRLIFMDKSYE